MKTLLTTVYQELKRFPPYFEEAPKSIWLGPAASASPMSTSLAGVLYCVVSEYSFVNYILVVNGVHVARGKDEILAWVADNFPITLAKAWSLKEERDEKIARGNNAR